MSNIFNNYTGVVLFLDVCRVWYWRMVREKSSTVCFNTSGENTFMAEGTMMVGGRIEQIICR